MTGPSDADIRKVVAEVATYRQEESMRAHSRPVPAGDLGRFIPVEDRYKAGEHISLLLWALRELGYP